jgi:dienelactone hydrolase
VTAIRCPVLGFYGEEDPIIPLADVDDLRRGLAASGRPFEIASTPAPATRS